MKRTEIARRLQALYHHQAEGQLSPVHLCLLDGQINFCFPGHTDKPHRIFFRPTRSDRLHGLTHADWMRLTEAIVKAMKENPKCLDHVTHSQPMKQKDSSSTSPTANPKAHSPDADSETDSSSS